MSVMASQITSLTIVYSNVYSGEDQRKHQSSVSLAIVRGIHRWLVNSPHKGPVTWKMFPFDDVIMFWGKYSHFQCTWTQMGYICISSQCPVWTIGTCLENMHIWGGWSNVQDNTAFIKDYWHVCHYKGQDAGSSTRPGSHSQDNWAYAWRGGSNLHIMLISTYCFNLYIYHQISNIRCTKSRNSNISHWLWPFCPGGDELAGCHALSYGCRGDGKE